MYKKSEKKLGEHGGSNRRNITITEHRPKFTDVLPETFSQKIKLKTCDLQMMTNEYGRSATILWLKM